MAGLLTKLKSKVLGPTLLAAGSPAPGFRLPSHDGRTIDLADLKGRKVLLWFYPKADTPGCTIEGKGLCGVHAEFERRGVVVLGASFDTPRDNRAFAEKFGFPFALLCDTDRSLGLAYGACDSADAGFPRRISYLIDEQGIVAHVFPKVDPATHAAEVLALVG